MNYIIKYVLLWDRRKTFENPYNEADFNMWIDHEKKVHNRVVMKNNYYAIVYVG